MTSQDVRLSTSWIAAMSKMCALFWARLEETTSSMIFSGNKHVTWEALPHSMIKNSYRFILGVCLLRITCLYWWPMLPQIARPEWYMSHSFDWKNWQSMPKVSKFSRSPQYLRYPFASTGCEPSTTCATQSETRGAGTAGIRQLGQRKNDSALVCTYRQTVCSES